MFKTLFKIENQSIQVPQQHDGKYCITFIIYISNLIILYFVYSTTVSLSHTGITSGSSSATVVPMLHTSTPDQLITNVAHSDIAVNLPERAEIDTELEAPIVTGIIDISQNINTANVHSLPSDIIANDSNDASRDIQIENNYDDDWGYHGGGNSDDDSKGSLTPQSTARQSFLFHDLIYDSTFVSILSSRQIVPSSACQPRDLSSSSKRKRHSSS
jgi:hypothetical protein